MSKNECELCGFNNPKATSTAIIIRDNKLLVLKRNEEPFKGQWDLPGGYVQANELPELTLKRELSEELGVLSNLTFLGSYPGKAYWQTQTFAILGHFYLAEIEGEIKLNDENSEYNWIALKEIVDIAFDSNKLMLRSVKENFTFDLKRVEELLKQLDPSAVFNEQSFYKSIIEGHLEIIYEGGLLIGMGWIYPRQTALRKQAVVEDLIVDEAFRGKGYGRKIMLGLHAWASLQGVEVVELTTNPKRVSANELYKKLGYKLHETNHYLFNL